MSKKLIIALTLAAAVASPAYANGSSGGLLGALVSVGNHGSIANVGAAVDNRNSLANVGANLLGGAVKATATVDQTQSHGYGPASSSLADVNLNVLNGAVKANVAVDQNSRHDSTLLGISATVLDGGVGNRGGHW